MGWRVNTRKSGDAGIDGWDASGAPIQLKNHVAVTGRQDIQKFYGAIAASKSKRGTFVAWEFSRHATEYASTMKTEHDVEINLMRCAQLLHGLLVADEEITKIENLYIEKKPKQWADTDSTSTAMSRMTGVVKVETGELVDADLASWATSAPKKPRGREKTVS